MRDNAESVASGSAAPSRQRREIQKDEISRVRGCRCHLEPRRTICFANNPPFSLPLFSCTHSATQHTFRHKYVSSGCTYVRTYIAKCAHSRARTHTDWRCLNVIARRHARTRASVTFCHSYAPRLRGTRAWTLARGVDTARVCVHTYLRLGDRAVRAPSRTIVP